MCKVDHSYRPDNCLRHYKMIRQRPGCFIVEGGMSSNVNIYRFFPFSSNVLLRTGMVLLTECLCHPKIHIETLIPKVMVLGGGAFER